MNEYWVKGGHKEHAATDLDRELEEYHKQAELKAEKVE